MFLPYQDATETGGAGDRSVTAQRATIDQLARLSCRFLPRQAPNGYLVRRIVVQGPDHSEAAVYVGDPSDLTMADVTRNGAGDVADYAQPLYVPPALDLWVIWTDRTTGANYVGGPATARIETEDLT